MQILRCIFLFLLVAAIGCGTTVHFLAAAATKGHGVHNYTPIHLPQDNAMHPWAHNEWWYVVGQLVATNGQRFGFETTLFKFSHIQFPGSSHALTVYRSDVALTDITGHRFYPTVTYIEPGLGSLHLSTSKLDERVGNGALQARGEEIKLTASTAGAQLQLQLQPRRPALLVGGRGIVPMGSHGYSYYYSLVDLAVSGRVYYMHRWFIVNGLAWLDHQWGNWNWRLIRGWTWMAIQLDTGVDFSLSDFHATGTSLHGVSLSFPNGRQETIRNIHVKVLSWWRSPHDHTLYPSGWHITLPRLRASLNVMPLVRDQEVRDTLNPAASYWEGASTVQSTFAGRHVTGQAYVELVGFASHFAGM
jgi:predicted secreted hydrolase